MFESIVKMQTKARHHANESEQIGIGVAKLPVHPTCLIVLAVGVVVSGLRPANLISHQHHRSPDGEQVEGYHVLDLLYPQDFNFRNAGRAFDTAIPTQIGVGSV